MEAVVRTVVVEPREEPDRVTTQHQVMVERIAKDLVLQTDNVIHNHVQVIFIDSKSRINCIVYSAINNSYISYDHFKLIVINYTS